MKYINSKGEEIEITKMPDAYLVNSYLKKKKDLEAIQQSLRQNPSLAIHVAHSVNDLNRLVEAMKMEVVKRNLI